MDNSKAGGGIGFFGCLTLIFVVLKLTRVIAWSWLWVLSPIWIPIAIVVAIIAIMFVFNVIRIIKKGKK